MTADELEAFGLYECPDCHRTYDSCLLYTSPSPRD